MNPKLQPPQVLVGIGFLMLLLTSLQGWGMVGIIVVAGDGQTALLQELKRLHNLGLAGGFLAIAFGLAMLALPLEPARVRGIYRVLLPSLLVAPIAFADRMSAIMLGSIPSALQMGCYGLQALSALGITVSLVLMLLAIFRRALKKGSGVNLPPWYVVLCARKTLSARSAAAKGAGGTR